MFPRLFKRALSTGATEIKPKVLVGNEKYILGIVLGMSMFSIGTYLDIKKTIDKMESRIHTSDGYLHKDLTKIKQDIDELKKEIATTNKKVDETTEKSKQLVSKIGKSIDQINTGFEDVNNRIDIANINIKNIIDAHKYNIRR